MLSDVGVGALNIALQSVTWGGSNLKNKKQPENDLVLSNSVLEERILNIIEKGNEEEKHKKTNEKKEISKKKEEEGISKSGNNDVQIRQKTEADKSMSIFHIFYF